MMDILRSWWLAYRIRCVQRRIRRYWERPEELREGSDDA